jgi:putative lipase involved disintegration of autophagic bodies
LTLFKVKIYHEMLQNLLAVSTGAVKDTINGVLVQIHDSGSCSNTVALGQATNDSSNCVFVGMQAEEYCVTSFGESGFTDPATQ